MDTENPDIANPQSLEVGKPAHLAISVGPCASHTLRVVMPVHILWKPQHAIL